MLINRPDEEATGAGETSITLVAAAIGNAIFDATGARIRASPVHAGASQSRARHAGLTQGHSLSLVVRCSEPRTAVSGYLAWWPRPAKSASR